MSGEPRAHLVVEREADGVRERPLEQRVVVAGQQFDVNGHVRALARAVAVQKQRRLWVAHRQKRKKDKRKSPGQSTAQPVHSTMKVLVDLDGLKRCPYLELVAVLAHVERGADQLVAFLEFGVGHLGLQVAHAPQESSCNPDTMPSSSTGLFFPKKIGSPSGDK